MKRAPLGRFFDLVLDGFAYLAGIILLAMILFVSYACFARYLNINPPVWILQFTEYALLWVTFFGAAWLLRQGGHIRMDTFVDRLTIRARRIVYLFDDLLGFGVCLVLFWFGTLNTLDLYRRQIVDFNSILFPKYLIFWVIPFGGLLLLLQFARNVANHLRDIGKPVGPAAEGEAL
jgi:TRAP-type C4-dicarboxylate transport system permease small subunit